MDVILITGRGFIRRANGRTKYPSTTFSVITIFGIVLFRTENILIIYSVVGLGHILFQSEFSRNCDLVFLSSPSIFCFP
jgi:hypothetical protein